MKYIIRNTKNKKLPKINKIKKKTTLTQILLYPICYILVNMIYNVTRLTNGALLVIMFGLMYINESLMEFQLIGYITSAVISISMAIFMNCSVKRKKTKIDPLEKFLEENSTSNILIKFKCAKRNVRLQIKKSSYLKRKLNRNN